MSRQFIVVLLALAVGQRPIMLVFVDRRPWRPWGSARKRRRRRSLGAGLALGALGILLPSGVLLMAHWLQLGARDAPELGSGAFALQLAVLFLPQSLAEEMLQSRLHIRGDPRGRR